MPITFVKLSDVIHNLLQYLCSGKGLTFSDAKCYLNYSLELQ